MTWDHLPKVFANASCFWIVAQVLILPLFPGMLTIPQTWRRLWYCEEFLCFEICGIDPLHRPTHYSWVSDVWSAWILLLLIFHLF